jgi:hypothetical protein
MQKETDAETEETTYNYFQSFCDSRKEPASTMYIPFFRGYLVTILKALLFL